MAKDEKVEFDVISKTRILSKKFDYIKIGSFFIKEVKGS